MGMGREVVGRRKDGDQFHLHLSIGEMVVDGRRKFVGTVQDISARKQSDAELRDRDERLGAISELSPVGLVRMDANGDVTYANETYH